MQYFSSKKESPQGERSLSKRPFVSMAVAPMISMTSPFLVVVNVCLPQNKALGFFAVFKLQRIFFSSCPVVHHLLLMVWNVPSIVRYPSREEKLLYLKTTHPRGNLMSLLLLSVNSVSLRNSFLWKSIQSRLLSCYVYVFF